MPDCMSETSPLKPCQESIWKKWLSNVEAGGSQEDSREERHRQCLKSEPGKGVGQVSLSRSWSDPKKETIKNKWRKSVQKINFNSAIMSPANTGSFFFFFPFLYPFKGAGVIRLTLQRTSVCSMDTRLYGTPKESEGRVTHSTPRDWGNVEKRVHFLRLAS